MQIVQDKALLVTTAHADKIKTAIGKCKIVKDHPNGLQDVLVHWDLHNAQLLRNLGIKNVPSTISRDYNWPGLYKPFDHQRKTAEFLTLHKRGFCFNEQGTSKTASVLWAADYLLNIGQIKRVLVVCPLSIMKSAWVGDAFKTIMHRNIQVAHGTRKARRQVIDSDADIVVINFDGIEIIEDAIAGGGFDLIVIDEANAYKTPSTNRWKAMKRLVKPETWLWMLTGTPASQSPEDAFGLAKLCVPSRVPNFAGAWRDKVMVKVGMFKYVPTLRATELVNQALQPAIRFEKKDCLDLPPVMYQSRDVPLTKQQEKYYKALKKQMLVTAAGEEITAVHAAAALNKLLQISCGAVYSDSQAVVAFDCSNRINVTMEIIEESSHKVIIFVPFKHAIDIVLEKVRAAGYSAEKIDGSVPVNKRTEIFRRFQDEEDPHVLVVQPQAAAHGVTLTAANTIIWFGPTMSVETWLQANERINRPGQKNHMTVIKLVGSAAEQKVYKSLEEKTQNQASLIALYNNIFDEES